MSSANETQAKKEAYPQHPLSAVFPPMLADEYQALVDSIGEVGVLNPITLFEGMVLDGWHRYRAATECGMDCPVVPLDDVDPREFVLALNKARRHMTAAQSATATTLVYAWAPVGNPGFVQSHTQCVIAKTNAELAAIAGVHPNTIIQAKTVQKKGAPEVQNAVMRGEIGLPKAAKIAAMAPADQVEALRKPLPKAEAEPEDDGPRAKELAANAAAQAADALMLEKLLHANEPLALALEENKRLNAKVVQLQQRIHGLMNEKNEAIGLARSRGWQIAKLEKLHKVSA